MNSVKLLHIKCCFFQFFNSPVALKNKKKFWHPQEKVEMTPLGCSTVLFRRLFHAPCCSTMLFHRAVPPCCSTVLFHRAVPPRCSSGCSTGCSVGCSTGWNSRCPVEPAGGQLGCIIIQSNTVLVYIAYHQVRVTHLGWHRLAMIWRFYVFKDPEWLHIMYDLNATEVDYSRDALFINKILFWRYHLPY